MIQGEQYPWISALFAHDPHFILLFPNEFHIQYRWYIEDHFQNLKIYTCIIPHIHKEKSLHTRWNIKVETKSTQELKLKAFVPSEGVILAQQGDFPNLACLLYS